MAEQEKTEKGWTMPGLGMDQVMLETYGIGVEAAERARDWWRRLPDEYKGSVSIWVLIACYAEHERKHEAAGGN